MSEMGDMSKIEEDDEADYKSDGNSDILYPRKTRIK